MKKFKQIFLLFLLICLLLNCAPYKMKAIRAHRDKRHALTIEFCLKHLRSQPNDKKIVQLLSQSARDYFEETKAKIEHFEKLNDWHRVIQIASRSDKLLRQVAAVYGVDFPTKLEIDYLKQKMDQSGFNRADEIYANALQQFNHGDFETALDQFLKCAEIFPHFKDVDNFINQSKSKLAEKYYQKGLQLENSQQYQQALENYQKCAGYISDFLDVQRKIQSIQQQLAQVLYQQAIISFDAGNYRQAQKVIEQALEYQPENIETLELSKKIKNKLTVRLAILPFSGAKIDKKFAAACTDALISEIFQRKGDFIELVDRENLQKILEEQALSQTGVIDDEKAVEVGKLSGVNTIAVGNVVLLSNKLLPSQKSTQTGFYEKTYRDKRGVQRKKKEPFTYTRWERRREVAVQLSYRLIDVETGKIVYSDTESKKVVQAADWIEVPANFVQYLSSSEQAKLKSPRTPPNSEILIQNALDSLTKIVAQKIIRKISPF